jgi:hypothetical protein
LSGLLDLSEEFVTLNRQIEKKRTSLRGRTQINPLLRIIHAHAIVLSNSPVSGSGRM